MKRTIRHTYLWLMWAIVTLVVVACSADSETVEPTPTPDAASTVKLRIATQATTRARTTEWADANAQDDEMMNLWVVILTNAIGEVQKSWACRPAAGAEREIDDIAEIERGVYKAYSFANISVENVCSLLGLTANTVPTIGITPTELAVSGTVTDAANKTATIKGNGFDPNATNNGYGEKGIPMSNVQAIVASDTEKDLIVIRMLAKIELRLFNETGAAVTVQSVTLSDVTDNVDNNLKLLPSLKSTDKSSDGHDSMESNQGFHADIQPNLNGTPSKGEFTYNVPSAQQTVAVKTYSAGATPAQTLTFYVNESATPSNAEELFYLTLKMSDSEFRYALISNQNSEWNYIARNDYRVIPIVLDDYHFELVPYDFPPIGVYPVSVKALNTSENLYEFTFHDYGHFHLLPRVTNGSGSPVPFDLPEGTNTHWSLSLDDTSTASFAASFFTAATKGGAWLDADGITSNGFYRNQTATTDGDEAGGAPVWYANTASPQWRPTATDSYQPFIFGYIADPGAATKKQIYHEMRVKLYVDGSYRRDMLYRFYMTLSDDQMLYAPRRAAQPRRHH